MNYFVFVLGWGGWILSLVGLIRLRIIFHSKMTKKLIDELSKNLYSDVVDKIQEVFDCVIFRNGSVEYKAMMALLKLSIPPEQTKLRYYQRFLKTSLLLIVLGLATFFIPYFFLY